MKSESLHEIGELEMHYIFLLKVVYLKNNSTMVILFITEDFCTKETSDPVLCIPL